MVSGVRAPEPPPGDQHDTVQCIDYIETNQRGRAFNL